MVHAFRDSGNVEAGEALAFAGDQTQAGRAAEIPATCLPVLVDYARCEPGLNAAGERVFVFPVPRPPAFKTGPFERAAAAFLAVLLSPLFLAVACLIYVFDGAPVFFLQERYGLHGRPFMLVKFRTMVRRSEELQEKLQRKLGRKDRLFKLTRDPRVTRTGGFLRRAFIDELPQLVNVACGEMRFVGPRPLPASDCCHYTQPYHQLRLNGLPGMTGLWQISGRNARTFDEMCLLDYYYICNRSAALDLRIIGRTALLLFKQIIVKGKAERGGQ